MFHLIFASVIDDIAQAASNGIQWASDVAIFVTAAMMAISLLSWLFHRSS